MTMPLIGGGTYQNYDAADYPLKLFVTNIIWIQM